MTSESQCSQIKASGKRCKAKRIIGSKYCFWHDPNKKKDQVAARKKGGKNRCFPETAFTLPSNAPAVTIESARDIVKLLSESINQVRLGELNYKLANSMNYMCSTILKALEQGELDERLKCVEEAIAKGVSDGSKPH